MAGPRTLFGAAAAFGAVALGLRFRFEAEIAPLISVKRKVKASSRARAWQCGDLAGQQVELHNVSVIRGDAQQRRVEPERRVS